MKTDPEGPGRLGGINSEEALVMGDMFSGFIGFIMSMIKYIQDLVAYFRAKNEGKDAQMPELPAIDLGGDTASEPVSE